MKVTGPGSRSSARVHRPAWTRLWTSSFGENTDLSATDRAYVAQAVATQTGMSQADAQMRVNEVIAEAKADADRVRSNAVQLAFWLTASLLFGAFAASLAAVEGGQLRDGTWESTRHGRLSPACLRARGAESAK